MLQTVHYDVPIIETSGLTATDQLKWNKWGAYFDQINKVIASVIGQHWPDKQDTPSDNPRHQYQVMEGITATQLGSMHDS